MRNLKILAVFAGIAVLHLIASIFCGIKSGGFGAFFRGNEWKTTGSHQRWKDSRIHKHIVKYEYVGIYLLIFLFLFSNSELDSGFLFSTMILYITATSFVSTKFSEAWKTSDKLMRVLICTFACVALISHVQQFAVTEFGKIPKSVGGGKPEIAYVKFSAQHPELAAALNLPSVTNTGLTNGFFGPIGILLRSEREILFINYADASSPEYLTNEVVLNAVTNSVPVEMTNSIIGLFGRRATNVVATFKTNIVYNVSKYILKISGKTYG
ncbi:MAG TPA: hypothetical protein VFC17_01035 [Candidatus Limnocylindrales bacterium]|nr:hypothetical protein [Candidatus Limnocylindrales bacterium]